MDLPTELIEHICEILKAQNWQKSLAGLNAANKFLNEVTTRYLWESVRWTPRLWEYCFTRLAPGFCHTKYIMLVSPEASDEDNGWERYDEVFFDRLLSRPIAVYPSGTFGQLVHICFPNIKYVVCVSVPPIKAKQNKDLKASVYVSDQNLITKNDAEAVRKMVFDTLWEIRRGKNAPRKFTDIEEPPQFLADRLNMPGFDDLLKAVGNLMTVDGGKRFNFAPEERAIGAFEPFRNVASMEIADVKFKLHLMTAAKAEDMPGKINGKRISLFSLTRRVLTEDRVTYNRPHLTLSLDIDFSSNKIPTNTRFFDRATMWIRELASQPLPASKDKVPDVPFDLYVRMPEQFTNSQFKSNALAFHQALSSLRAESSDDVKQRLPVSVVLQGFLNIRRPTDPMFARMDFTSREASRAVCFGTLYTQSNAYHVTEYYQDGRDVTNDAAIRSRLERLFA